MESGAIEASKVISGEDRQSAGDDLNSERRDSGGQDETSTSRGLDGIETASDTLSGQAREAAKKKRASKTAKLKQNKLDARREQWLSQVNGSKITVRTQAPSSPLSSRNGRESVGEGSGSRSPRGSHSDTADTGQNGTIVPRVSNGVAATHSPPSSENGCDEDRRARGSEEGQEKNSGSICSFCCSVDGEVPELSRPDSGKESKIDHDLRGSRSKADAKAKQGHQIQSAKKRAQVKSLKVPLEAEKASAASSVTSTSWSGSGSENSGDEEEDWEAAADAIYKQSARMAGRDGESRPRGGKGAACRDRSGLKGPDSKGETAYVHRHHSFELQYVTADGTTTGPNFAVQDGTLRPEYKYHAAGIGLRSRSYNGRAWRPDDISRPNSLPPVSKEGEQTDGNGLSTSSNGWHSGTAKRSAWSQPAVPSFCPICTEELDLTDSSFIPCGCGFRLCLFCHHRIASDDGRCPGCRKVYSKDSGNKLSRSVSLWLRV